MKEKLTTLYLTMNRIEVKGENAKLMADCLRYVEQLVKEEDNDKSDTETT